MPAARAVVAVFAPAPCFADEVAALRTRNGDGRFGVWNVERPVGAIKAKAGAANGKSFTPKLSSLGTPGHHARTKPVAFRLP